MPFLSIGKIGHEGPSIFLEDLEHWVQFTINTDFCDLKAGPLIVFSTDSSRDVLVGAVQPTTHIALQY